MARITQKKKDENLVEYNKIILNLFLTEGWDSVTYDNLAKIIGVKKSTLQGYYPSNKDFSQALKGNIFPIFHSYLDFSSEALLIESWDKAFESTQFRMIMYMLIGNSVEKEPSPLTVSGVQGLIKLFEFHFGSRANLLTEQLLGRTVLKSLGL